MGWKKRALAGGGGWRGGGDEFDGCAEAGGVGGDDVEGVEFADEGRAGVEDRGLAGGRDGKMLTYATMAVVCASTQWAMRRR